MPEVITIINNSGKVISTVSNPLCLISAAPAHLFASRH
jgi:hypothetical protein